MKIIFEDFTLVGFIGKALTRICPLSIPFSFYCTPWNILSWMGTSMLHVVEPSEGSLKLSRAVFECETARELLELFQLNVFSPIL